MARRLPLSEVVPRRLVVLAGLALLAGGCASTRITSVGPMPQQRRLVTLVVTKNRDVVERECGGAPSAAPIYGCQLSIPLPLPDGAQARAVKIVRLTDALPSEMAFEIEAHELCHAVASLQPIEDPCHLENGGMLRADLVPRAALPLRP